MPSFGGSVVESMGKPRASRPFFPALLALAAVGLLACATILGGSSFGAQSTRAELVGAGGGNLAQMQREVQQQLVEAAKRRAKASEHRAQAVSLEAKAKEDSERAVLLHEKADLSHKEAELRHSDSTLAHARLEVKKLKEKASKLGATADKDTVKADKDKEEILELEDKAGKFSQQAGAEADKIKVVEAAEAKVAKTLPSLLDSAKDDAGRAGALKTAAAKQMKESTVKSAKAKKLDALARDKEAQARAMRERLMDVLQQKAKTLETRQEDAAESEVAAKRGAQKAAQEAEALAESAEKQAQMAEAAERLTSTELPSEKAAESLLGDQHEALHAAARGKQRMEGAHHEVMRQRREDNLRDAGNHAAALRSMRSKVASDSDSQAPAGVEDEDGHLQLQDAGRRSQLEEDGHFSHREEQFKAALASAYRKGYTQQLSEDDGKQREAEGGGHASLGARKPARLEMLGDVPKAMEMLSKGQGDSVSLDKENAPTFSMLWEDGSSLGSETRRLRDHTRRLGTRYAPPRRSEAGVDMARLYEDGHTSREEQAFTKDMRSYRGALRQERSAALAKAHRATQELSQLPGGREEREDEVRSRDLRRQMHRVQGVMLSDPHDHWEVPARHGGDVRVREDEDGHLVLDHGRDYRREDRLRSREGREEELSSSRGGRLERIQEELRASQRRDRRLEDRTERLQGEVAALRGGGRMEALSQRDDEGGRGERRGGRREERREGPRREERGREEERGRRGRGGQGGDRRGGRNFSPDATYEKEYAGDPGHVSVAEIKFQHALKGFQRTKSILREGAMQDDQHLHLPQLVPSHLPGQGL